MTLAKPRYRLKKAAPDRPLLGSNVKRMAESCALGHSIEPGLMANYRANPLRRASFGNDEPKQWMAGRDEYGRAGRGDADAVGGSRGHAGRSGDFRPQHYRQRDYQSGECNDRKLQDYKRCLGRRRY